MVEVVVADFEHRIVGELKINSLVSRPFGFGDLELKFASSEVDHAAGDFTFSGLADRFRAFEKIDFEVLGSVIGEDSQGGDFSIAFSVDVGAAEEMDDHATFDEFGGEGSFDGDGRGQSDRGAIDRDSAFVFVLDLVGDDIAVVVFDRELTWFDIGDGPGDNGLSDGAKGLACDGGQGADHQSDGGAPCDQDGKATNVHCRLRKSKRVNGRK